MKDIALILAGGGGKGAYHIGVWKALREFGIDRNISATAGTSVGALNAALFMQGDYEVAEQVWRSITHDKLLNLSPKKVLSMLTGIGLRGFFPQAHLVRVALNISQHGIFSREGLQKIMADSLDKDRVAYSHMSGYAACCRLPLLKAEYFKLNDCDPRRLESILFASSALPLIYGAEEIDGEKYIDGGLRDNLPIRPLYEEGYRQIILVHLNRETVVDRSKFPDANLIEIMPRNHQGGLFDGTLDFSPSGAERRINEGYTDTVHIFKPIYEMGKVQQQFQSGIRHMAKSEEAFAERRMSLRGEREQLQQEMQDLMNL